MTDPKPISRAVVDRAAMTADSLRPVAGGVCLIFGALVPVHFLLLTGSTAQIMAGVAAATSLVMLVLWGALYTELGPVLERHAQGVGAGVGAMCAANTLTHVATVGEPWVTTAVILVVVAVGACLSSRKWVAAVVLGTDAAWALIVAHLGVNPVWVQVGAQLAAASVLAAVFNLIRHRTVERLELAKLTVAEMAVTDELTGLANRRGLLLAGRSLLEVSRRTEREVTVLYLDVDGLKQVNDEQGHAAGDRLIASTGEVLQSVFRSADVVARLGGDEFAIVLSGAGKHETAILQERLRSRLAENGISASVGVVYLDPTDTHQSLEQLVDRADLAMYAVKRALRAAATPVDLRSRTA